MKSANRLAFLSALILIAVAGCKKDNSPHTTVSFSNQSLGSVQAAIHGKWRGLYSYFSGFNYDRQDYTDTTLGYYTIFYSDHIVFKNKSGDSTVNPITWKRIASGTDSVYAFDDSVNPSLFGPFAVTMIQNDTLYLNNLVNGEGASGALYKRP